MKVRQLGKDLWAALDVTRIKIGWGSTPAQARRQGEQYMADMAYWWAYAREDAQ